MSRRSPPDADSGLALPPRHRRVPCHREHAREDRQVWLFANSFGPIQPARVCGHRPEYRDRPMATAPELGVVVLCVDGSDHSTESVREGFALLQPAARVLIATVVEPTDASLVTGSGMAGGVISGDEFDNLEQAAVEQGQQVADAAAAHLGIPGAEITIVRGDPGVALCTLATDEKARALVMGSRGRGGIKRALLGSVSDYVVRNAPCPVVITTPRD